jgi:hypothetical protein
MDETCRKQKQNFNRKIIRKNTGRGHRYTEKDNIKKVIKYLPQRMWTGLKWLQIRSTGKLL